MKIEYRCTDAIVARKMNKGLAAKFKDFGFLSSEIKKDDIGPYLEILFDDDGETEIIDVLCFLDGIDFYYKLDK